MAELANRFTVHHFPRHRPRARRAEAGDRRAHPRARHRGQSGHQPRRCSPSCRSSKWCRCSASASISSIARPLKARSIPVSNTPGLVAVEVADLAIGLMLASARQIIYADRYVREGHWRKGADLARPQRRQEDHGRDRARRHRSRRSPTAARRSTCACSTTVRGAKPDVPYDYVADRGRTGAAERFPHGRLQGRAGDAPPRLAAVIEALGPEGHADQRRARDRGRRAGADRRAQRTAGSAMRRSTCSRTSPTCPTEILALPNVIVQPHHGSAATRDPHRHGPAHDRQHVGWLDGRILVTAVG